MSFTIGFVIFPNLTQLDFTGPLQVLHRLPGATTHIVAKTREPVPSDCPLTIPPTVTFADCPPLDLLCVPGGFGVDQAMEDEATIAFVRREGARAKYVTSVCTGAFILGAAGLLRGPRPSAPGLDGLERLGGRVPHALVRVAQPGPQARDRVARDRAHQAERARGVDADLAVGILGEGIRERGHRLAGGGRVEAHQPEGGLGPDLGVRVAKRLHQRA